MALISDIVVASFVTGSLALASVITPLYIKNRRALKRGTLPAEEFIERFMKRQEQEIAYRDRLLEQRAQTISTLELAVKKWSEKAHKYESVIRELKNLLKKLREENKLEKQQSEAMKTELKNLKETYENMYSQKLYKAIKEGRLDGNTT